MKRSMMVVRAHNPSCVHTSGWKSRLLGRVHFMRCVEVSPQRMVIEIALRLRKLVWV